jgi:putative ABC transport system substrate-binding protein
VDRRQFVGTVTLGLLTTPLAVGAQPAGKMHRVGVLVPGPSRAASSSPPWTAFVSELRGRGYVEGQNLHLDVRFGGVDLAQGDRAAAELVASNPDVIVVVGPAMVRAAVQATSRVPIVMLAGSTDPVAEGLVASLARPGGNLTGLTYAVSPERFGKQLEVLKEAIPRITRVAVLWDIQSEIYERAWAPALSEAAARLRLAVLGPVLVRELDDLEPAFRSMIRQSADAILVGAGGIAYTHRARIAALALQNHLPMIAAFREFPQTGGLMSYGPSLVDVYRRGAAQVIAILRGARPGDLPVEQPTKFELVINLKTAKALGLTIPPAVLARADELIQ